MGIFSKNHRISYHLNMSRKVFIYSALRSQTDFQVELYGTNKDLTQIKNHVKKLKDS